MAAVTGIDHVVIEDDVRPHQATGLAAGGGTIDEFRLELFALPVEVPLDTGQLFGAAGGANRPQGHRDRGASKGGQGSSDDDRHDVAHGLTC